MKKEKKTRAQLMEEIREQREVRSKIVAAAEAEARTLTSDETNQVEECRARIAALQTELDEHEPERGEEERSTRQGSLFVRALRELYTGDVSDEVREMTRHGRAEMRSFGMEHGNGVTIPAEARATALVGTNPLQHPAVATELQSVLEPLRNNLVLTRAGATMLTGLSGNVAYPRYSGSTASWEGETTATPDTTGTFSTVSLTPKRLSCVVSISKQLLLQDSADAEGAILRDFVNCLSDKLEGTILGGTTIPNAPAAMFVGAIPDKGVITWPRVVAMESAVEDRNALSGKLAYITNARGKGILRTKERGAATPGFIAGEDGKSIGGYPLLVTNAVPKNLNTDENGLIFADWTKLVIGQWGGLDITIDPYTQADKGVVRFVVDMFLDAKWVRDEAYAKASFKA